jgi:hypothetical protein
VRRGPGSVVGQVNDGAIGEDALHAGEEDVPFVGTVEVVTHEEAATEQEVAEFGGLLVGQFPVADFDGVEPRPVVNFVPIVGVDGLLDGAHVDAGKTADGG